MPLTINTKTYTEDASLGSDGKRYAGPDQSYSSRDHLDIRRTFPKKTATYAGNSRAQWKFTRTGSDGTDDFGDMILNIQSSIPAKVQLSEISAFIADVADAIGLSQFADSVEDNKITF